MKHKIYSLLFALIICFHSTACSGREKMAASDKSATTLSNVTTTTTANASSAETTLSTTTVAVTEASTIATTVTTEEPTSTTRPSDKPQTVASPFADVNITQIDLYDTHFFQIEESNFIKSLTETDSKVVAERLVSTLWEYYPTQDKWVKYNPIFAEWALVLTDTDGKQWLLHLLSADTGWSSLGTFDGGLAYADIIAQAKAHSKDGAADFHRYKIDQETLTYLLSLF